MIAKATNLILLLASVAWLAREPGWEPGIAVVSLLLSLLALEYQSRKAKPDQHDIDLFAKLQVALPQLSAVDFTRHQDFGGPFRTEQLTPLFDFAYKWDNAAHEFNDAELNRLRTNLLDAIKDFSRAAGKHTFDRNGTSRVPADWHHTHPELWREAVREINDAAERSYQAHEALVREARRKLTAKAS